MSGDVHVRFWESEGVRFPPRHSPLTRGACVVGYGRSVSVREGPAMTIARRLLVDVELPRYYNCISGRVSPGISLRRGL